MIERTTIRQNPSQRHMNYCFATAGDFLRLAFPLARPALGRLLFFGAAVGVGVAVGCTPRSRV
jgi:hypothetical protein